MIEDFFDTKTELDPVREAINELVDGLAIKLHDAGKIKSKHGIMYKFILDFCIRPFEIKTLSIVDEVSQI